MITTNQNGVLITSFDFNEYQIRTTELDGDIWFVAVDVCNALEIANSRDAVNRLDDYEKAMSVLPTQFGAKEMNLVNESGLYSLVFTSRKAEAKAFKKKVTCEILPSIRKTGKYDTQTDSFLKRLEGVPHIRQNELVLYLFNGVRRELGLSIKHGAGKERKRYPQHFWQYAGGAWYITADYAKLKCKHQHYRKDRIEVKETPVQAQLSLFTQYQLQM
jgi:prophage antirepressor-like protein